MSEAIRDRLWFDRVADHDCVNVLVLLVRAWGTENLIKPGPGRGSAGGARIISILGGEDLAIGKVEPAVKPVEEATTSTAVPDVGTGFKFCVLRDLKCHNPFGVEGYFSCFPGVARSSQPRADILDSVGVVIVSRFAR